MRKGNKKVLLTIPQILLDEADATALSMHMSRCEFFRQAVRAAIARSAHDELRAPVEPVRQIKR